MATRMWTGRIGVRGAFAVLLWLVAAWVPLCFAVHAVSPTSAVTFAAEVGGTGSRIAAIAIAVLGVALLSYPPFVPGLRVAWRALKGRMSVDQGPLLAAEQRLQHLETGPDHLVVARTRLAMGDRHRALPHLIRAVELEPDQLDARALLGKVAAELGVLPRAIEQLGIVVQVDPDHAFGSTLLELGKALERADRDADAERELARFEEKFGPNREADVVRARIAWRRGDTDAARRLLTRAARPLEGTENSRPESALWRARARVRLWRTGGRAAP